MSEIDNFDPFKAFTELSAHLEQPDKFAETFCKAAEKQKSIDTVLKNIFRELLKNDKDTVEQIKIIQRQVNKEDLKHLSKQIGLSVWSIVMLIIGAVITLLSKKILG